MVDLKTPQVVLADADIAHFATLPELTTAVTMLWCSDYWDGPKTGVAEFEGQRFRFVVADDFEWSEDGEELIKPRKFWLVGLTPIQLAEIEYWHEEFRKYVSTRNRFTGEEKQPRPYTEHDKFYGPYNARKKPDYSGNTVVGWFTDEVY